MKHFDEVPRPVSIAEFCAAERISPETFRRWSKDGLTPRALVPARGRWRKIGPDELRRWRARREADALKEGRLWLKHPLEPLSWVAERERLAVAQRVAAAVEAAHAD